MTNKDKTREASRQKWREDRESSERVLQNRRERYASDPAYREAIKDSVRRRRAQSPASDRKRSFNRDRIIMVDGKPVTLWSIGRSAHHIGVKRQTLEKWDREAVIPKNRCTDEMGRRWFPSSFIDFIAEQYQARLPNERLITWASRVEDAWNSRQKGEHQIPKIS